MNGNAFSRWSCYSILSRVVAVCAVVSASAARAAEPRGGPGAEHPFRSAVAIWQFADEKDIAGKDDLKVVGPARR